MVSGFGDMGSLLKQAQEMQKRLQETEQQLESRKIEGSAGGGAVKVVVNGKQEVESVTIDPEAVDPDDVPGLETLVKIAFTQALDASRELKQAEMAKVTGGMNLPGMGF